MNARWPCRPRGAAVAVAAVAAFAVSACGGDEPATQPAKRSTAAATESPHVRLEKSFNSARYDYTLRHPGDWSALRAVRSLGRDELVSYTSDSVDKLSKDPSGIQRPELTIGAQKLVPGTSLDELRALTMQRIRDKGGCRPPAQTSTTVGGERATLLMYSPCGGLDLLWTVVLHGRSGFHVVWWDAPGKAAAHRPLYEAILASIAFKE
jgi:hypothetical protein